MPTYQYACTECAHQLEVVQRFSDDPLTVCAECGGRLRKVFSPVGIVFKGSGFYRNDSRKGAASGASVNGNGKQGGEGSAGADGSSGKSESGAKGESGAKSVSDSSSSGSGGSSGGESSGGKAKSGTGSAGGGSKVA